MVRRFLCQGTNRGESLIYGRRRIASLQAPILQKIAGRDKRVFVLKNGHPRERWKVGLSSTPTKEMEQGSAVCAPGIRRLKAPLDPVKKSEDRSGQIQLAVLGA